MRDEGPPAVAPPCARLRVKQYLHVIHPKVAPESFVLQNRLDGQAPGAAVVNVVEIERAPVAPRPARLGPVVR